MKRTKLLSLMLAFALVLTTAAAGAGNVFADTSQTQPGVPAASEPIAAVNMNFSAPNFNDTPEYSNSNPVYIPVSIPSAGTFVFDIRSTGSDTTVGLFQKADGSGTAVGGKTKIIPAAESADDFYTFAVNVKKSGNYYLKFQAEGSVSAESYFSVKYIPANKAESTVPLEIGRSQYASVDNGKYRYFKITVPETSYLQIYLPPNDEETASSYKVKLMDFFKKKNLFKGVVKVNEKNGYITYAGVRAGTYYIGVSTDNASYYRLNVYAVKVDEKSGESKAKAKKISKGKTIAGVITATQANATGDWYKFVVTRKQKVQFETKTLTGGSGKGLSFAFYNSKKLISKTDCSSDVSNKTINPGAKNKGGVLPAGTYWIKVQKNGGKSGYYELKWK